MKTINTKKNNREQENQEKKRKKTFLVQPMHDIQEFKSDRNGNGNGNGNSNRTKQNLRRLLHRPLPTLIWPIVSLDCESSTIQQINFTIRKFRNSNDETLKKKNCKSFHYTEYIKNDVMTRNNSVFQIKGPMRKNVPLSVLIDWQFGVVRNERIARKFVFIGIDQ